MEKRLHRTFSEFRNFINESLFSIESDIDMIIERSGIGEFYRDILSGDRPYYDEMIGDGEIVFLIMDSGELRSSDAKLAHSVNPVHILIGFPKGDVQSQYNPLENYVLVSPNRKLFRALYLDNRSNLDSIELEIFDKEFRIERFRQSLAHELSHWISDSVHNFHIKGLIDRANELGRADYMKLRKHDVNMTYFEIDALVHGIKELWRGYTLEEWDALTFGDLMGLYSSMRTIESRLRENYGEEVSLIWQRSIVKRLDREGLLGRGMRSLYRVKV